MTHRTMIRIGHCRCQAFGRSSLSIQARQCTFEPWNLSESMPTGNGWPGGSRLGLYESRGEQLFLPPLTAMTTVAYTSYWDPPTSLSGSSVPTWTVTNTRATSRSATRWYSATSLRASATSRLTPCQPGRKRYSTYGACEPSESYPRRNRI